MSNFTTWRSLVDGEEIAGIPDSEVYYPVDEGSGQTFNDYFGDVNATTEDSITWISDSDFAGGFYADFGEARVQLDSLLPFIGTDQDWSLAFTMIRDSTSSSSNVVWQGQEWVSTIESGEITFARWDGNEFVNRSSIDRPSHPFTARVLYRYNNSSGDSEIFLDASEGAGSERPNDSNTVAEDELIAIGGESIRDQRYAEIGVDAIRFDDSLIDPQDDFEKQLWS